MRTALGCEDKGIRYAGARAIRVLDPVDRYDLASGLVRSDPEPKVRAAAIDGLYPLAQGTMNDQPEASSSIPAAVLDLVTGTLKSDPSEEVRMRAIEYLSDCFDCGGPKRTPSENVVAALAASAASDVSKAVRDKAAWVLRYRYGVK